MANHTIRNLHVPHISQQTRDVGQTIADEIMQMEDVLKRSEAAFATIHAAFQHSISSSKMRLGNLYNSENPFLQLATETLSQIMEEASTSVDPVARVEVSISHVCRRLRHIALSTPSLWTRVTVPGWSAPMMEAYLTRSGSYLLDVDLTVDVVADNGGLLGDASQAIAMTLSNVWRWRSLKLSYNDHRTHLPHQHGAPHPLPFLEPFDSAPNLQSMELCIVHEDEHHEDFVPDVQSLLFKQGAPSLTKLVFRTQEFNLLWLLPPLENIVSLTIGSVEPKSSYLERPPIPILSLLSHRKLRQFALTDARRTLNFRDIRFDLTIPPRLPASSIEYSRLRSLRIPLQVIPGLVTLPQRIFEETTHLFVDINLTDHTFPDELFDLKRVPLPALLPKLDQFTLYAHHESGAHLDVVASFWASDVLLNLSNSITRLCLPGEGESIFGDVFAEHLPDHWPSLEVLYLGRPSAESGKAKQTLEWCLQRKAQQSSFVVEVPSSQRYLHQLSKCHRKVQKFRKQALEMGLIREAEGPTLPAADAEWLPM